MTPRRTARSNLARLAPALAAYSRAAVRAIAEFGLDILRGLRRLLKAIGRLTAKVARSVWGAYHRVERGAAQIGAEMLLTLYALRFFALLLAVGVVLIFAKLWVPLALYASFVTLALTFYFRPNESDDIEAAAAFDSWRLRLSVILQWALRLGLLLTSIAFIPDLARQSKTWIANARVGATQVATKSAARPPRSENTAAPGVRNPTALAQTMVPVAPSSSSRPRVLIDEAFSDTGVVLETRANRNDYQGDRCKSARQGGLVLETSDRNYSCLRIYPMVHTSDVRIETSVTELVSGARERYKQSTYELMIGGESSSDIGSVGLIVRELGGLLITRGDGSHLELTSTLADFRGVDGGPTRLAIEIRGRSVAFFINDQLIYRFVKKGAIAGNVTFGIGAGRKIPHRVRFNFLRVTELPMP